MDKSTVKAKSFDKKEYDKRYLKEHTRQKLIAFNLTHDADILERIETVDEPFAAYVKRLIREDMHRET